MQAEEELTVRTLIRVAEGCWVVTTVSGSVYEVDLDNSTLTRRPSDRVHGLNPMRRDGDPLRIIGIVALAVGRPALFLVDLDLRGVACRRRVTTTVVSIDSVGPGVGSASLIAEFTDLVGAWDDGLAGRDVHGSRTMPRLLGGALHRSDPPYPSQNATPTEGNPSAK